MEGRGRVLSSKVLCIDTVSYRPMPDAVENFENYVLSSGFIPLQLQKYLGQGSKNAETADGWDKNEKWQH